ncbi:MAG: thioredoxin family protein [Vannielia sp.]|uniref:thioredoxin family protein n=1 Tax=Rhodobacterales TaxID=204455 RepID=UPI0020942974|nr:thioredoxin family protein [Oceanicola sp. 502str15]MCO6383530.1 thioredoxin fold domain-containing protein [Oceanicola sp. 502str15]
MRRLIASAATALLLAVPSFGPAMAEAPLGDDGLHKPEWLRTTFLDLREDLEEARAEGKRYIVMVEQRGCIYCIKMHNEVFPDPEVEALIEENFFVVQINLYGSIDVTDFDGTTLPESEMAQHWGTMFTPTMFFLPEEVPEGMTAAQASVATMPGAFEQDTMVDLLTWVRDKGYEGEESFQRYHGRMVGEREEAAESEG